MGENIKELVKQYVDEYMESKKYVVDNSTIVIKEPFDFADVVNQMTELLNSNTTSGY